MADEAAKWCCRCWLWVLLCAGSWSVISGQNEEVVSVPENQAVNLPCRATTGQGTPTRQEWKFMGSGYTEFVYYQGKLADNYKDRAIFYPNELHLKSVTRKDSGKYICQVVGSAGLRETVVDLVVQVPPSKPKAVAPSSVTIGNKAVLTCVETDGSPQPTFKWYKNDIVMPVDPQNNTLFQNSSYTLDPKTGMLTFEPATEFDAGDYACEADNKVGLPQKSEAVHLEPMKSWWRDKINKWIVQLLKIIPDCSMENTQSGQSKGGTLSKVCDYIQALRQCNLRLSEKLQGLDQLQMDNEVLRQQVEELKNENLILRAQLRQHGAVNVEDAH